MVTPALFERYPTPRALATRRTEELEPQIHSTGFFRAKSKALIGMAQALVAKHAGEVPADMDALTALAGRRPEDGERRARACARRAGPSGRSSRAARRQPNRRGRGRRPREGRSAALRAPAEGAVDARLGLPDPPRPARLQTEAALLHVPGPGTLRLLPHSPDSGRAGEIGGPAERTKTKKSRKGARDAGGQGSKKKSAAAKPRTSKPAPATPKKRGPQSRKPARRTR